MAPVGQARTQSSHAVQRLKSMTGNPNDARVPNGLASVRTPVFRLVVRMLNMPVCPSDRVSQRSFPEYDRLKLLLITGKSGTMLVGTACTSPGQFKKLGSVILTRASEPFSS